jgi:hypothetical protein
MGYDTKSGFQNTLSLISPPAPLSQAERGVGGVDAPAASRRVGSNGCDENRIWYEVEKRSPLLPGEGLKLKERVIFESSLA